MGMIEPIIMEFSSEAATTRKLLERLPEDKFGWQPHDKSMSLGLLGSHIVEAATWLKLILEQDEMQFDRDSYVPVVYETVAELLDAFDKGMAEAVEVMQGQSDENLMATWRMAVDGKQMFEMPRIAVIRGMILNHIVHHRGQLSVYLRLNDVPVPSIYGPSADDPGM